MNWIVVQIDLQTDNYEERLLKMERTAGFKWNQNWVLVLFAIWTKWLIFPHQAPLSVGLSRQEYWSGLLFPPSGDLPDPVIKFTSPAVAGGFFTTNATWEAQRALLSFSNSVVSDSANPCQASLSFTLSRSLLKFMSIVSLMPSNHLILCCPHLLLPSIFQASGSFSNESALCIR